MRLDRKAMRRFGWFKPKSTGTARRSFRWRRSVCNLFIMSQFLLCKLGSYTVGIPSEAIAEVIEVANLSPIPGARSFVEGIVSRSGKGMIVVCLDPDDDRALPARVVALRGLPIDPIGVRVGAVLGFSEVPDVVVQRSMAGTIGRWCAKATWDDNEQVVLSTAMMRKSLLATKELV
jgi:chemotaxis signal transduction protein